MEKKLWQECGRSGPISYVGRRLYNLNSQSQQMKQTIVGIDTSLMKMNLKLKDSKKKLLKSKTHCKQVRTLLMRKWKHQNFYTLLLIIIKKSKRTTWKCQTNTKKKFIEDDIGNANFTFVRIKKMFSKVKKTKGPNYDLVYLAWNFCWSFGNFLIFLSTFLLFYFF